MLKEEAQDRGLQLRPEKIVTDFELGVIQAVELQFPTAKVQGAHPNVFELVELFKGEQADTEVSIAQLAAGGVVRQTRKKYVTKEKRLTKIAEKFRAGSTH